MDNSYIKHIKLYLESGNENRQLLRTLIDEWFAYYSKGPFLNRNGKPKWFNNPCPEKNRDALLSMHFISAEAFNVINRALKIRIVKDHSIPINVLHEIFRNQNNYSESTILNTLLNYYRLGIITKDEDKRLNLLGLRSKMPSGWRAGDEKFARYTEADIIANSKIDIQY